MRKKYTDHWNLRKIHRRYSKKKLNLNPEYQRDAVWTLSQKQLLIDSLMREIDIPKIYFREKNDEMFEVVDGQQRIIAITEFMDNKVKLSKDADKVNGEDIALKHFNDLSDDLQDEFENKTVDIVIYSKDYSDDEIEETFLRLQNGTPLNSAEKRRAINGNMRVLVAKLGQEKVFENIAAFTDKRYAFEDIAAKILHQQLFGTSVRTDIRAANITKTYENNAKINENDNAFKRSKKALKAMDKAFKNVPGLKLKKHAFLDWSFVLTHLYERYTLQDKHLPSIGTIYADFEKLRYDNASKDEDKQDPRLSAYTDAARSDSIANMEYRSKILLEEVLTVLQDLELKDNKREFSDEQRFAILLRDNGKCQVCSIDVGDDFEIDHIKPFSKGGKTQLSNAQLLCKPCNRSKSDK